MIANVDAVSNGIYKPKINLIFIWTNLIIKAKGNKII